MNSRVVLTFDLEDWFQLTGRRFGISAGRVTRGRLKSQVSNILDLLELHDARATFFVLGMTAELCPEVIAEVAERGHEIASHGFGHQLVRSLDPDLFRVDIERSVEILHQISGRRPTGYRAPEFSIDRSSFWAFDVLLDCGVTYDSSVFPFQGQRYGIADAPLGVHRVRTPSGRQITEIPLAVVDLWGKRLPIAGGGYWRLLPGPVLDWAVSRVASERTPMLYFHPYEFDSRTLNLSLRSRASSIFTLKQNLGRASIMGKLRRLVSTYRCVTAEQFLELGVPALAAE